MLNLRQLDNLSKFTNESKFFFGLTMMLFNFGSKYIVVDISKSHEAFLKSTIIRRITIFCMFFVATKDLYVSLLMTAVFIVLAYGIFDSNSKMCILPKSLYDDNVTEEEYSLAKELLRKYEDQQNSTKK